MTLNVQVISDVHVEFHGDRGGAFLYDLSLDPASVDVLVVAGDLATHEDLGFVLRELCSIFPHVVYLLGNHEFYGHGLEDTRALMGGLVAQIPNLHWLDRSTVTIKGQRFVGCPMWFPFDEKNKLYEPMMNDFTQIQGFKDWVYRENEADVDFLRETVAEDDVVVTHYLPTEESVSPRFKNNILNRFFLCDVREIIAFGGPKLWVHGHTHDSLDYEISETRVVCNPYGYKDHEENRKFNPRLVLEV